MISMMVMVRVIEKSSEITIFETVEAVIEVFLVKTSALRVIAFIVTVEVGQQIPANKVVESISEKRNSILLFIWSTPETPAAEVLWIRQDSDHGDLLQYRETEADTQLGAGRAGHEAEDVVTRDLRVSGCHAPGAQ